MYPQYSLSERRQSVEILDLRSIHTGFRYRTSVVRGDSSRFERCNPGQRMCKFADDTYLIIPACNVHSRVSEIEGIEAWARTNNLALNRKKTLEIVFRDGRRKRLVSPPPMADIERVTTLKILGVTITNTLSTCLRGHQVLCTDTIRSEDSPRIWLE